jgi:hypothetical protein
MRGVIYRHAGISWGVVRIWFTHKCIINNAQQWNLCVKFVFNDNTFVLFDQ